MAAITVNVVSLPQIPAVFFPLAIVSTVMDVIPVAAPTGFNPWPQVAPPPTPEYFRNRTWHTGTSVWVFWLSPGSPDPAGALYPGPGTFGVDTVGFVYIAPIAGG